MKEEDLKDLYGKSEVAKAFLDHMASRQRAQSETKVDRILRVLNDEGFEFSRGDIVDLFQKLEEIECGQFVVGRHGWPSRFVWNASSLTVSRMASGEGPELTEIEENEEAEELPEEEEELLTHTFNLRPDLTITIDLPQDLTAKEAERLSLFVKSLPMEEFE
ncbi:hypothetical protein [Sulfurivermis fontis]|jgi:hypothetical protein|uniref:hypothetical protein n=1 Tax=Sulfurivermis fontis TaxID=1972068 RepID=UPI000FD90F7A|nr:hypothetical protein [Sulfurivermis fontis]